MSFHRPERRLPLHTEAKHRYSWVYSNQISAGCFLIGTEQDGSQARNPGKSAVGNDSQLSIPNKLSGKRHQPVFSPRPSKQISVEWPYSISDVGNSAAAPEFSHSVPPERQPKHWEQKISSLGAESHKDDALSFASSLWHEFTPGPLRQEQPQVSWTEPSVGLRHSGHPQTYSQALEQKSMLQSMSKSEWNDSATSSAWLDFVATSPNVWRINNRTRPIDRARKEKTVREAQTPPPETVYSEFVSSLAPEPTSRVQRDQGQHLSQISVSPCESILTNASVTSFGSKSPTRVHSQPSPPSSQHFPSSKSHNSMKNLRIQQLESAKSMNREISQLSVLTSPPDFDHISKLTSDCYLSEGLLPDLPDYTSYIKQDKEAGLISDTKSYIPQGSRTTFPRTMTQPRFGRSQSQPVEAQNVSTDPKSVFDGDQLSACSDTISGTVLFATSPHVWRMANNSMPMPMPTANPLCQQSSTGYPDSETSVAAKESISKPSRSRDFQSMGPEIDASFSSPEELGPILDTGPGMETLPSPMAPKSVFDSRINPPDLIANRMTAPRTADVKVESGLHPYMQRAQPGHRPLETKKWSSAQERKGVWRERPSEGFESMQMRHSNFKNMITRLRTRLLRSVKNIDEDLDLEGRIRAGGRTSSISSQPRGKSPVSGSNESSAHSSELVVLESVNGNRLQQPSALSLPSFQLPNNAGTYPMQQHSVPSKYSFRPAYRNLQPQGGVRNDDQPASSLPAIQSPYQEAISTVPFSPRPRSVRSTPGLPIQQHHDAAESAASKADYSHRINMKRTEEVMPETITRDTHALDQLQPNTRTQYEHQSGENSNSALLRQKDPTEAQRYPRSQHSIMQPEQTRISSEGEAKSQVARHLPGRDSVHQRPNDPPATDPKPSEIVQHPQMDSSHRDRNRSKTFHRGSSSSGSYNGGARVAQSQAPPPSPKSASNPSNSVSITNSGAETPGDVLQQSKARVDKARVNSRLNPQSGRGVSGLSPSSDKSTKTRASTACQQSEIGETRSHPSEWIDIAKAPNNQPRKSGRDKKSRRSIKTSISRGDSTAAASEFGRLLEDSKTASESQAGFDMNSDTLRELQYKLRAKELKEAELKVHVYHLNNNLMEKEDRLVRLKAYLKNQQTSEASYQVLEAKLKEQISMLAANLSSKDQQAQQMMFQIQSIQTRYENTRKQVYQVSNRLEAECQELKDVETMVKGRDDVVERLEAVLSCLRHKATVNANDAARLSDLVTYRTKELDISNQKLSNLDNKLRGCNQSLILSEQMVKELQAQLTDKNATIQDIDRAISELHKSIQDLQARNKDKKTMIDAKQQQIQKLQDELTQSKRDYVSLNASYTTQEGDMSRLRAKTADLEWNINEKSSQVSRRDSIIGELRRQVGELEWECLERTTNASNATRRLENMVRERDSQLLELRLALEAKIEAGQRLEQTTANLRKDVQQRDASCSELQRAVERTRSALKKEKQVSADLEIGMARLIKQNHDYQLNISRISRLLAEKESNMQDMQSTIDQLRSVVEHKSTLLANLQQNVGALRLSLEERGRKFDEMLKDVNQQLATAKARASQLEAKLADRDILQRQKTAVEAENHQLRLQILEVHKRLDNVSRSSSQAVLHGQQTIRSQAATLKEKDRLVTALRDDIKYERSRVMEMNHDAARLRNASAKLRKSVDELQGLLRSRDRDVASLENTMRSMEAQFQQVRTEHVRAMQVNQEFNRSLVFMQQRAFEAEKKESETAEQASRRCAEANQKLMHTQRLLCDKESELNETLIRLRWQSEEASKIIEDKENTLQYTKRIFETREMAFNETLSRSHSQIQEMKQLIQDRENSFRQLQRLLNSKEYELNQTVSRFRWQYTEAQKVIQDKDSTLATLRKNLEIRNFQARQEIAGKQSTIAKLHDSIAELHDDLSIKKQTISRLTVELSRQNATAASLELRADKEADEIVALKTELLNKIRSMARIDRRYRRKYEECQSIESMLQDERRKRLKLEEEKAELMAILAQPPTSNRGGPNHTSEQDEWL